MIIDTSQNPSWMGWFIHSWGKPHQHDGFTTVGAAVALLVCLSLVWMLATVQWHTSTAAEIQDVADAAALAGANTVAKFETVVTVADAVALSLGMFAMIVLAIASVTAMIPYVSAASVSLADLGVQTLKARQVFAERARATLQKIAALLPAFVVVNSALVITANQRRDSHYVGAAVPFPLGGDLSDLLGSDLDIDGDELKESIHKTQEASDELVEFDKAAKQALHEGWLADCGAQPYSMYERAGRLSGIPPALNPYYPTDRGWNFGVGLKRAREYYRARLASEAPRGSGVDAAVDSACRKQFYRYALEQLNQSYYRENADGSVSLRLLKLASRTAEIKETRLYTDAVWPVTQESQGLTLHYSMSCPGATGSRVGSASLAEIDQGACHECPHSKLDAARMGKTSAASTSISNGFEHWYKKLAEAAETYEQAKNQAQAKQNEAKSAVQPVFDALSEALTDLAAPRISLDLPGKEGCIAVVVDHNTQQSPLILSGVFEAPTTLGPRAAIGAARLAAQEATQDQNVVAAFFDGLSQRQGVGSSASGSSSEAIGLPHIPSLSGMLDVLFEAWGGVLLAYGDSIINIKQAFSELLSPLKSIGLTELAAWAETGFVKVIESTGFEPVDLRLKKPVITSSVEVLEAAGYQHARIARELIARMPSSGSTLEMLDVFAGVLHVALDHPDETREILGELDIPGFSTELEVDLP